MDDRYAEFVEALSEAISEVHFRFMDDITDADLIRALESEIVSLRGMQRREADRD
jgi:hypothetical protein